MPIIKTFMLSKNVETQDRVFMGFDLRRANIPQSIICSTRSGQ